MSYDSFILNQNRYSEADSSGNISYRIDITCSVVRNSSAVTKLLSQVFVYSTDTTLIADVSSGGSIDGNFLRVATIADLSLLPVGLEDALASNKTEFRSNSLQLSMPDLETAVNAVPIIVDRVNSLVSEYIKYQESFFTELSTSYSLPRESDTSVVSQYSTAYSNAVSARSSAEVEQALLNTEYQSLQIKSELLSSYRRELESYRDSLIPELNAFTTIYTSAESSSLKEALTPAYYKLLSLGNLLEALCSNREASSTAVKAQEAIKLSELNNKEDELSSLQAAEAAALSDLAIFCPQVDVTSL